MLGLMLVHANTPARAGMSPGRSEPGGRGPRLETKVAFRYVPGMAHTGRPRLGLRVMMPAERVRRHRAQSSSCCQGGRSSRSLGSGCSQWPLRVEVVLAVCRLMLPFAYARFT